MKYTEVTECAAPEIVFTEPVYENIPLAYRSVIDEQGGLPCDGGGVPGRWCHRCFWNYIESQLED